MSIRFTSILLFIFICNFTIQASQDEQIVVTAILPKTDSWVSIATDASWEHQDEIFLSPENSTALKNQYEIFLSPEELTTLKNQLLAQAEKKALIDSFSDEESESDDESDGEFEK
jgi:hypothetical protein